jgi:hypothetical protein
MAEKLTVLRVFVASPGDVSDEREKLKVVIDELNHGIAGHKGLILKLLRWETDAWPGFGEDAQDVINQQIGPYDIFIGILWKRFGTPTKRAGSGTEEEFEQAYTLWSEYGRPRIMLYFNMTPFYPSTEDTEQFRKVLDFKEKAGEKGALYWEYNGSDEFKEFVRSHLTKEILRWENYVSPISPPPIVRLPLDFYQALFKELDKYIDQFDQLQRDYNRELKGEQLEFAVDFSEIRDYMYPYSMDSPRSSLNRYVFKTIDDQLTLMPGAVGELLTDLERTIPFRDELDIDSDPMTKYKEVSLFVNNFFTAINDEEKIVRLYSKAEEQLKKTWGELFNVVIHDGRHNALYEVKTLIDQGKLSPVKGIQEITQFPLDVKNRAQSVRNYLDINRPERSRNNQVDTIDFAVTWLLNMQKHRKERKYFSIYTQSHFFINACTLSHKLRWDEDYLVRGSQYFKFRTRLQELRDTIKQRYDFVVTWRQKCGQLQKEIKNLDVLEKEPLNLKEPSLALLDLYRQFDEECRIPLTFTGKIDDAGRTDIRKNASKLYALLKEKGAYKGRTDDAFEVLKKYLQDLQEHFTLFAPEKVHAKNSKTYMENLAKWIDSESLEDRNDEKKEE